MNFSLKSLWNRQAGGWSAVDMQGGVFGVSVKLPQRVGAKPVVVQHVVFLGQQVADGAVLAQMARGLAGSAFETVTLLARHQYQVFMVDKPAVRPDEMDSSLRLVVSSLIDYPIAEAALAWFEIPVQQSMGSRVPQLYTVVARNEHVAACSTLFEQAHLRLDAVDIRESAQRNISWLLENEKTATCMIHAGSDGVQLTITHKRELYLLRFIGETLLDKAGPESRDPLLSAVERLALEIHRSFDFVRRNYPSLQLDVLYVAPTLVDIDLANLLRPHLMDEVKALDLSVVFEFPQGSELKKTQVQAQLFHALGSALRIHGEE